MAACRRGVTRRVRRSERREVCRWRHVLSTPLCKIHCEERIKVR
jgi:hypothetical protein